MRKLFFILIFILGTLAVNAQFFAGGTLGLNFTSTKNDGTTLSKSNLFVFSPEAGYKLNEKFDVGLGLNITSGKNEVNDSEVKTSAWNIAPFARYTPFEYKKFDFMLRGGIFVGGTKNGDTKFTNFGLNIAPVIGYNISSRFQILANLNFFGLGFNYSRNRDTDDKTTSFGLNANTDDLINTGDFQIGFVVNF